MKKRPTLRQVLAGYLLATGGLCLLAAAVWWGSFAAMVRAGVLWPADWSGPGCSGRPTG